MQIRNVSGLVREIANHPTRALVEPGDTVEVDDELGASLCEQAANWQAVDVKPTPKSTKDTDR